MKVAKYTLKQFRAEFPNDDACLQYLWDKKYRELGAACPECESTVAFNRVKNLKKGNDRRSYQCPACAFQVYPTAGTIFHQSTTPLTTWFNAIYLFTTTRTGVSAKELERTFDICYHTALRMAHKIKIAMGNGHNPIFESEGIVDETFVFGEPSNRAKKIRAAQSELLRKDQPKKKAIVGIADREGKNIATYTMREDEVVSKNTTPILERHISKDCALVTDWARIYLTIGKKYSKHVRINHKKQQYVKQGYSTNRIENYWSRFKAIMSTHVHISQQHMKKYVDEVTFRYVNRETPELMFHKILDNI